MNHPEHANLEPLLLEVPDFCLQSKAVNTRRSYEGAYKRHQLRITWINDAGDIMCPTNSVKRFINSTCKPFEL
jgi:hypothetical protein